MAGQPKTRMALANLDKIGIDNILERLGEGATTQQIADACGVSRPILSKFLNLPQHRDSYALARETRAGTHAERIEELATMVEAGTIEPNTARVSIDARKWIASRMDAGRWGDKNGVQVNVSISDLHLGSLRKVPTIDSE